MEETAGQVVRRARLEKGLTQRALASLAGVSDSLITLIELGKKGISPAVAGRLSRSLEVAESTLLGRQVAPSDKAQHLSVMRQVCSIVARSDAVVASCLAGKTLAFPETGNLVCDQDLQDLASVQQAVCKLVRDATAHGRTVRAYLEGYQDDHRHAGVTLSGNLQLLQTIDRHVASGNKFEAVLRIGQDVSHDLQKVLFGMRLYVLEAMRGRAGFVQINFLSGNNIHRFVRDLWTTEGGYVDAFPKDFEYYVDQGFLVAGDFPPLRRYICNIRRHTSSSTILAYGAHELGQVCKELGTPTFCDTRLLQPFFTDASRPASEFIFGDGAPSSTWMNRVRHAHAQQSGEGTTEAVRAIAEDCQKRAVSLHDHLRIAKFTQIYDLEVVKRWADTGLHSNIPPQFKESRPERIRRLENVKRMLESHKTFSLIGRRNLRGDGSGDAAQPNVAGDSKQQVPLVAWLSDSNGRLMLSGSTSIAEGVRPDSWKQFESAGFFGPDILLRDQSVAASFNSVFDDACGSDADVDREKRKTIEFIKALKVELESKL